VADEVWKSNIYNIRCTLEAMEHKEKFVVWIDYNFHHIKKDPKTQKVAVDKFELGEEKQLKTRKYQYWKNAGFNSAVSTCHLCTCPEMFALSRWTVLSSLKNHGKL
jgi:hypothetical protein